ncbi:MAG TPA: 16S rRNA (adenine(1518)-N(6)/adenine(1519)-N(6))-dimethyltransferase RsmA [Bdellovibrionota bacterium]|jgi:16S rRNA (adenine1518-N6/adenine1519-N6)-dimethyltransferase
MTFAKKSLGQNFLIDKGAIAKIVQAVPPSTPLLLEIGPGRGALSSELFQKAERFCVLEKDDVFAKNIGETLFVHGSRAHTVFHSDALEFDWERIWTESGVPIGTQLSVCANLPYNVATEIFFRLLALRDRIPLMVLMFQKEVAERIAAKPGTRDSGTLSVAAQNFYSVRIQQTLKPGAFRPSPKVDSAVLEFKRLEQPIVPFASEEAFSAFMKHVRAAFAHRRKTLLNSLSMELGHISKAELEKRLASVGIEGIRRAETLTIAEFGKLHSVLLYPNQP